MSCWYPFENRYQCVRCVCGKADARNLRCDRCRLASLEVAWWRGFELVPSGEGLLHLGNATELQNRHHIEPSYRKFSPMCVSPIFIYPHLNTADGAHAASLPKKKKNSWLARYQTRKHRQYIRRQTLRGAVGVIPRVF